MLELQHCLQDGLTQNDKRSFTLWRWFGSVDIMRSLLRFVYDWTTRFIQTTAILKGKHMSMGRNTKLCDLPDTDESIEKDSSHNNCSMC